MGHVGKMCLPKHIASSLFVNAINLKPTSLSINFPTTILGISLITKNLSQAKSGEEKTGSEGVVEMAQKLATKQMATSKRDFGEKVKRLNEILQTFSHEEMRKLALIFEHQLDFHKRSPLFEMELIITYRCNLACNYCFMRKQNLSMDRETALQSIDFLLAYSKDHPFVNVTFFGREPLIYLGLMEEVAEYVTEQAREMGKEVHFACTTNGTFW